MARAARALCLLLVLFLALQSTPASADPKACVVFSTDPASVLTLVAGLTSNFKFLYDFKDINAFALQIDDALLPALEKLLGVVAVVPDTLYTVHTTHSWDFLELQNGEEYSFQWQNDTKFGEGVIIANVDTGVSPTSESFHDDGMMDIPKKWLGKCEAPSNKTFGCNRKLIGARLFNKAMEASGSQLDPAELNSPWDFGGHGSHTLSTLGGNFVPGASAFGRGMGTAKGGSPRAHVASYKACFAPGCSGVDIFAAIYSAVRDGVHVLSLSVGAPAADYVVDLIAMGTLHAVRKGVVVVASAGNSGPQPGSVSNVAPWILTVGASTMDRSFPASVTFGDITSTTIKGQSLAGSTQRPFLNHEIISGEKANAAGQSTDNSTLCLAGSLDPAKVRNKIVVCTRGVNGRVEKGLVVKQAGGVGMVLCNDASSGNDVIADPHLLPAAHCSFSECTGLLQYILESSRELPPIGYITAEDAQLGVKPAPVMASFSSRGPNTITDEILKPDITAPGVSVIAAFSTEVSATGLPFDDRRVPYNVESGTSMSCPHVAGIAGLLKNKYPNWSPPMIKSAIMTTASTGDNDKGQIEDENGGLATPFSYGSGHVSPISALDPGLVYDTTLLDYSNFVCSMRPTQPQTFLSIPLPAPLPLLLFILFGSSPFKCSLGELPAKNLNYPSISATCLSDSKTTVVKRRVMNVGAAPWLPYTVSIVQPTAGVKISVEPSTLTFSRIGEEKEFTVKLDVSDKAAAANYVFGSFEWTDGNHRVRSPVVATTKCA